MPTRVEISYKTIIFTIAFVLFLWVVFQILDILFLLFLSVIAASGLRPVVDRIEQLNIPRVLAILVVYLVIISCMFLLGAYIIPILVKQTTRLVEAIGIFFSFSPYIDISAERITDQLTSASGNIYRATVGAFSLIINFFTFFVFAFYLLLERRYLRVFLRNFFGEEMKERIVDVLLKMEQRLGAWVRGEITLGLIIGTMTYIGLLLLNVEFALPLAIIAGFLELVPIVGPIISAIPAVIVTLLINPFLALLVVILYFLVQQLENHVIVPMVMKRAVGIPPMISILSILIGARLAGTVGAIISIPVFVCVQIILQDYFSLNKEGNPLTQPSEK